MLFGGVQSATGSRSGENGDRVFMIETGHIARSTISDMESLRNLKWQEIGRMPYSRSFGEIVQLSNTKKKGLAYGSKFILWRRSNFNDST